MRPSSYPLYSYYGTTASVADIDALPPLGADRVLTNWRDPEYYVLPSGEVKTMSKVAVVYTILSRTVISATPSFCSALI
ncbi:hypothetical protein K7X08_017535 [Anisodus acutangulus]|uniref:Uncharacterized protein n=1 Tax=Anisodus acutangulus TaxID=402998 RepID=A0A9Q1R8M7_9SOLA|nr:hypothetical protein K7X08_017535 [Anisodus acutangulus]